MARTINEILETITANAAKYPQLADLENNDSVVQVWRYAKQVMALGIAQVENSIDEMKQEVEERILNDEPGGIEWYRQKMLQYQHGDRLTLIDNRPSYTTANEAAQIVKHVSVVELPSNGALQIKVAANDGTNIVPLSADELGSQRLSYKDQNSRHASDRH